ncbi:hypothetical protein FQA39_LY18412 [Lamprigera yunnana]|nr:hypothetical protein FQA39_LY18412 [Lamprigera yunnana]
MLNKFKQNNSNDIAVSVRGAFKSYGNVDVLQDLNMTIPKGAVYALLGASGCGKTTLLGCITGRKLLEWGDVTVLNQRPGSIDLVQKIGYMPQQTGLQGDFTIRETFLFFGRILGMSEEKIKERTHFFVKLLLLPEVSRAVKHLSGGQQRRVSLAIAFFHEPNLVILDEPTVGVDPMLREIIWRYFFEVVRDGNVTIVITTHYIEETAQANIIGFLRGGSLISEHSPITLLRNFKTNSLQEVFLQLSLGHSQNSESAVCTKTPTQRPNAFPKHLRTLRRRHIGALVWKNALWLKKNPSLSSMVTILPVVLVSLFCLAIGHEPVNLKVAIVNYETRNRECNASLRCADNELSCTYIRYLEQRGLILEYHEFEESAVKSVQKGDTYASIIIRKNYSKLLRTRVKNWQGFSLRENGESNVDVYRDLSNKHIAVYIQLYLYRTYQTFILDYVESCDLNKNLTKLPMKWEPVYGLMNPNFTDFSIPAILLSIAFIIGVILTAWVMLIERNEASLERTLIMGINKVELLFAHIICEFGVMIVQMILTMICTFVIFGMTIKGSLLTVSVLLFLTGLCGICFGLLTSCITNSQIGVILIATGIYFSSIMTCGLLWPIEAMHPLLKIFATFLPLTKPTESLRNVLHRNWGVYDPEVYLGICSISLWIVIFLLISVALIKFQKDFYFTLLPDFYNPVNRRRIFSNGFGCHSSHEGSCPNASTDPRRRYYLSVNHIIFGSKFYP